MSVCDSSITVYPSSDFFLPSFSICYILISFFVSFFFLYFSLIFIFKGNKIRAVGVDSKKKRKQKPKPCPILPTWSPWHFHTNLTTIINGEQPKKKSILKKSQRNKPSSVSKYVNYKNWIRPYKRCAGEWERGVSSGSGEALLGSTQTGAVRESGHGRGTPGGGTGRSNWGTSFSLCFDLFPSFCFIFPPSPFSNAFRSTCQLIIYLYD